MRVGYDKGSSATCHNVPALRGLQPREPGQSFNIELCSPCSFTLPLFLRRRSSSTLFRGSQHHAFCSRALSLISSSFIRSSALLSTLALPSTALQSQSEHQSKTGRALLHGTCSVNLVLACLSML